MNVYKTNLRNSDIDVLYKVDPKRLSIKLCSTSISSDAMSEECTTTFECFSFEGLVNNPEVPTTISELPAFIDGLFYFGSEEEAQDFIKSQIGM